MPASFPAADAGGLDRAVCYLRYARFLTLTRGATRPAADVPGDNAAYGGDEARDFVGRHHRGFWELDLHHEIERDGGRIMAVPPATAELGPSYPLGVILRHRFRHGRHHGAARVRHGQSRARVLIPSPFVPLVLFARAARVALGTAGHRISFLRGTLPFLALAAAWAAGEAVGAVRGPGLDERRP